MEITMKKSKGRWVLLPEHRRYSTVFIRFPEKYSLRSAPLYRICLKNRGRVAIKEVVSVSENIFAQ